MASALVSAPLAVAKAFSPGHITGFFEIPHQSFQEVLYKGSRGAGFSIDRGIATTVNVSEAPRAGFTISINGVKAVDAEVSAWIVKEYLKLVDKPYFVNVDHNIGIPVGFGLGSSGAAALSLSYALNKALGAHLTRTQAAQLAHRAEIDCKTGLGTVIAEFAGGFEIRTHVGAPGVGIVNKIDLLDYRAVILCMASISTKAFLTKRMDEINGLGGVMLTRLSESRSVDDFLKMSHEFAQTLGLTEGKCNEPIAALKAIGVESSVALFGETVYTLVPRAKAKEAKSVLKRFDGILLICNVDNNGARVL